MSDIDPQEVEVDLTNCDREPIHILGHVQDFGCLLSLSADWIVTHASVNCAEIFGHPADALIGRVIYDFISSETAHELRTRVQTLHRHTGPVRVFDYPIFDDDRLFELAIHQSGSEIVLEIEPRAEPYERPPDQGTVQTVIARVQNKDNLTDMAKEAARGLKLLSGFDRVMVYKFEEDDSGTVIAEAHAPGMDLFLGLRYPASDIPKQARALYVRSPLRLISDVDGPTHAILPERNALGQPLDLSLAVTRAVSPIHLEYLRNMGVAASMSVSILRKGKLWGLFACHHRTPRHISYAKRTVLELFAQLFNYELAEYEMNAEFADINRGRQLHDQMMSQLSDGQTIFDLFEGFTDQLQEVIPFDGAAVYSQGSYKSIGSATTADEFVGLGRFLNTTPASTVYATNRLVNLYPAAAGFSDRVAGVLALPISRTPRDYMLLFRREIAQSVKWAGNPEKPVEVGPNGIRLTPRKSFEAWQEMVRAQSTPWLNRELRAAENLRVTLLEVVLKLSDESNAARKRAQDQQELLIAELNHRVRNILTLIRGLASKSRKGIETVNEYGQLLDARIHALARAHDQLTLSGWEWVSLVGLVETEVTAFLTADAKRVHLTGDHVSLSPTGVTTMALVIHELTTNAAKYGALSNDGGKVSLNIAMNKDGSATMIWREQNGPPVQAPTSRGFGTTIIERSIPFELQGQADIQYRMTGLEATFLIPAAHVRQDKAANSPNAPVAAVADPVGISGHALVVEDNMLIALDAAEMMEELGASAVSTAARVTDALEILDRGEVTFAFVDVNLGSETSMPIIERCRAMGIDMIVATGYGATPELTTQFPGLKILRKPYTPDHVKEALAQKDP